MLNEDFLYTESLGGQTIFQNEFTLQDPNFVKTFVGNTANTFTGIRCKSCQVTTHELCVSIYSPSQGFKVQTLRSSCEPNIIIVIYRSIYFDPYTEVMRIRFWHDPYKRALFSL